MYGEFLREVRTSRGISQAQLAELTGIPQQTLSLYERDRRRPGIDNLNKILVSCGFLLTAWGGRVSVHCPPPTVGWFPVEDDPSALEERA